MSSDEIVFNDDSLDVKYNCYICGCYAGQVNLSDIARVIPPQGVFDVVNTSGGKYDSYKLCSTCAKKMVEYMELLKNTFDWVDKPKPCIICDSKYTEITCDIDADDNEWWKVHCNDCDTFFSNDNKDWSEKETLKWWNELKR